MCYLCVHISSQACCMDRMGALVFLSLWQLCALYLVSPCPWGHTEIWGLAADTETKECSYRAISWPAGLLWCFLHPLLPLFPTSWVWLISQSIWSSSQLSKASFPCIASLSTQTVWDQFGGRLWYGQLRWWAMGWSSLLFNLRIFSLCFEPNSEIPASSCISLPHYFIDHLNNLIPELPHCIPTSPAISQVSWVKFLAAQRELE